MQTVVSIFAPTFLYSAVFDKQHLQALEEALYNVSILYDIYDPTLYVST
jgi:hypothetical protein